MVSFIVPPLALISLLPSPGKVCENTFDYNATPLAVVVLIHDARPDDYIRTRILTRRTFRAVRKAGIVAR